MQVCVQIGVKVPMGKDNSDSSVRERRRRHSREETEGELLDVALRQLDRNGVLAGVNLREVAKEAGINHGQIYQYFGDRRSLLRAAIQRILVRFRLAPSHWDTPFVERRLRAWDWAMQRPEMFKLEALLVMDGDRELTLFPRIDYSRAAWSRDVETGALGADADMEALHALTASAYLGYGIFRELMARELDVDIADLDRRTRVLYEAMLEKLAEDSRAEAPNA